MPRVVVETPKQLRELLIRYCFPEHILGGVTTSLRERVEVILPFDAPDGSPDTLILIPLSLDKAIRSDAASWVARRRSWQNRKKT